MFNGYNIFDAIWDLLRGKLEFTDKKVAIDRMNICNSCEARKGNFCSVCGCYLPAKTKLKKSECPMELW